MNINQTSSLNFNAKSNVIKRATTFRVPGKNGKTVLTDVFDKGVDRNITGLSYKIMSKGKVLEEKAYQNKTGFKPERLCRICEDIQTKVKEGISFLDELFKAQLKGGN